MLFRVCLHCLYDLRDFEALGLARSEDLNLLCYEGLTRANFAKHCTNNLLNYLEYKEVQ